MYSLALSFPRHENTSLRAAVALLCVSGKRAVTPGERRYCGTDEIPSALPEETGARERLGGRSSALERTVARVNSVLGKPLVRPVRLEEV
jgi:hypothetical protein